MRETDRHEAPYAGAGGAVMPTAWLTAPDPYTHEPWDAERMTQHPPDDVCRWVARHKVADCSYPKAPGLLIPPNPRFARQIARPVTAADLSEKPAPLAQPEPPAPWETT